MPYIQRSRRLISFLVLFGFATPAVHAQYFGQNKVRYRSFDFKVLKTEHFDIHYYDEIRAATGQFARLAERWNTRLEKLLGHKLSSRQPVILYGSHVDFRGTTVIPDFIGETTGGVTEGLRRRLIMPLSSSLADTDHVLGHELVHAFQYDITTRPGPMGGSGLPGALRLPLWFIEGMAEYLSVGPVDPHTAMWLRDAVLHKKVPSISQLDDPRYFPYRWGQALWAYIAGRYGDEVIGQILKTAGRAGNAEGAISSVLKISLDQLSKDWHKELETAYSPILASYQKEPPGRALFPPKQQKKAAGELNVNPALSPDGKYVLFFSERDLFSVDMFLAEAGTGRIIAKVTKTDIDPHFDSLQFVTSAGSWSQDGEKIAFGGTRSGQPVISIYDVRRRRIARRIQLPGINEVFSVTWAPAGDLLAVSAMAAGQTDLYLLRLYDGKLTRLTNDPYVELFPAWSPDGAWIAFSTDRFTANLEELAAGRLTLALIRPDGTGLQAVKAFPSGKHLEPQWNAEATDLFFVSDRDGLSNIYRVNLKDGSIRQLTRLATGVSGITATSPAFSVASKADRLAFSAFMDGEYRLYLLDGKTELAGIPLVAAERPIAGILPPGERASAALEQLLTSPQLGLPVESNYPTENYKPRLSLDYIAPPNVTVGASNFGPFVGGGMAFYWSDLLGYHNLMTAVQTATTSEGGKFFNSLSGIVSYQNQKSRWNWGLVAGQVPYLTGGYEQFGAVIGGQPVIVEQSTRYWEISREISGVLALPLNRAQRLEFSTGYQNISFAAQAEVDIYSATTGVLLASQIADIPTDPAMHMSISRAALVYDTSVFGGTSPVVGQSYRLEAAATAGSLNYFTFLADWRRYLRPVRPFTLAGRVMHFGRYGGDAESQRLQDLFLGYPSLVRGYEADSFSIQECGSTLMVNGACPAFDRLFGSRIAVANAELRIPLLGFLGVVPSRSLPPVESALFYDAGMAWTSAAVARSLNRPRKPVSSYGVSLRFNVLGYFIGQLSYVHANDRPLKPWMWEFSFNPGF